jgi:hypothetical protein
MRWILFAISCIGLLLAVFSRVPGLTALGAAMFVVGRLSCVLAFAQVRIAANARPETLDEWQLQQLRSSSSESNRD